MKIIIDVADEQQAERVEAWLRQQDLDYRKTEEIPPNGTRIAQLIDQYHQKINLSSRISDPVAWQREIRKYRKLPGRE